MFILMYLVSSEVEVEARSSDFIDQTKGNVAFYTQLLVPQWHISVWSTAAAAPSANIGIMVAIRQIGSDRTPI